MKPSLIGSKRDVDLTGALLPWDTTKKQPCFLRMPDSEYLYIPCFTSIDQLRAMMVQIGVTEYRVKQVDDGREFMSSFDIPQARDIRVILNPRYIAPGRIRFTQVAPTAS